MNTTRKMVSQLILAKLLLIFVIIVILYQIGMQILNVFYLNGVVNYYNFEVYKYDKVTSDLFILISAILFLIAISILISGSSSGRGRRFKSMYERGNYSYFLSKHQRKRGLIRVCYNTHGDITKFRLECIWEIIWFPFAKIQNVVCDHFMLPETKKWNTVKIYNNYDGKATHTSGVPLIATRSMYLIGQFNKVYYLPSNAHTMFIGSTGRGKTWSYVLPMLISSIQAGESIIVHDTKKELIANTYAMLKKNGYNIILLDFNTPDKGDAWNPIKLAYDLWKDKIEYAKKSKSGATFRDCNMSKSVELVADFALNLCYENDAKQPMWWQGAADMVAGAILLLFEEGRAEYLNFVSVLAVFDDYNSLVNFLKIKRSSTDESCIKLAAYIKAEGQVRASFDTVFANKLRCFVITQDIISMTSSVDAMDMRDMFHQKTAVFILTQSSKGTYYPLVTSFITQFYEIAVIEAEKRESRKLKYPFKLYLDEISILPPFKEIISMYTVSRGYNITFISFLQSIEQFIVKYGTDITKTVMDNNANKIFLGASSNETKEYFARECGKEFYYDKHKKQYNTRELITAERLTKFEKGRSMLVSNEWNPFIAKLPGFDKYSFTSKMETTRAVFERNNAYKKCDKIDLMKMIIAQVDKEFTDVGGSKFSKDKLSYDFETGEVIEFD